MDILGVRFRPYGQLYFFSGDAGQYVPGDRVVVETEQGISVGEVACCYDRAPSDCPETELCPALRRATEEDLKIDTENQALARQAYAFCQTCIRSRKLDMKLVDVEVFHDRSKIVFFFTAPARIDFRELVKDLVRQYRSRIELRQIGVRHETQMTGAVGNCGMVCCCRRFLRKFAPVTIRMAKEQNLFLNPAKISGICGRLLCCLSYEQENYDAFYHNCPRLGKKYQTRQGTMKVLRANMFRNSIAALAETGEERELTLEEWHALEPRRPEVAIQPQQTQPKPAKGLQEALLVVSVPPEALDDPAVLDEVLPPPEESGTEESAKTPPGAADGGETGQGRHKRRNRSRLAGEVSGSPATGESGVE